MRQLCILWLAVMLSSCTGIRYGNFTPVSQSRDAYLAQDAVAQLRQVYPPAQHTFCINQKVKDAFGMNLMYELRKKGYGVIETNCPKQKANLFYVVDEIEPRNLYRTSLYIGSQTLSKVYAQTNKKLLPVSAWSHKE
ncbi:conjugal transfer protein TrbH [Legionella busanensis]|nr:conjugal transfer protein TrbH [Legionella busanensis]